MSASVTILYEDQRAHGSSFGLHTLVKACVHDALSGDRYRIEKMLADARPLKGVQMSSVPAARSWISSRSTGAT
ncbi:hypothetical protein [Sorangium sp. So ce426]|uniref:hypothetical protein n=1 Tax=Sorangium sp. So ce426 TaxID=3133312 RepID=UPI003F5BACD8